MSTRRPTPNHHDISSQFSLKREKNGEIYETKESAVSSGLPHAEDVSSGDGEVRRSLEQRHISMIAIGGTIGTGLFLGMGEALHKGGPVGLVLGYLVM